MVVTVGFFDGVHIGHRRVLRVLCEKGGADAAVVTFWPHPRVVLQQDARDLRLLSSFEEKKTVMNSMGIDNVQCLEFTRELSTMTAEEFIRKHLIEGMGCTSLVLGHDNRFGSDGLSTHEVEALAKEMGLDTVVVPPCVVDDIFVSSTRVRSSLADGDVAMVERMLGRRYALDGIVVPGYRLGRTIGFPTANMDLSFPLKAIPGNGVYATQVTVHGKSYRAMTNIGVRPTLGEGGCRLIETNIFDFDEDIYGLEINVQFIAKVRQEKKFSSLDELARQLVIDKHRCYGYN